jgi:hypothetical protein
MTTLTDSGLLRLAIGVLITIVSTSSTSGQTVAGRLAPDNPLAAGVGESVAVSGNTAIVGAPYTTGPAGQEIAGAAYVFERDPSSPNAWNQVMTLTDDDPETLLFGVKVSIDRDTALVADRESRGGVVYVFDRHRGGTNAWGLVAKLTNSDPRFLDFGMSIAINGDTVIVGAWGAAFIFTRNSGGANAWGQIATLVANDTVPGDSFGTSVSISGAIAVVGAPYVNAAYLFRRDLGGPNAWGEVVKLAVSDPSSAIAFGDSVSVSGHSVVVGAPTYDVPTGAAYVYTETDQDDWRLVQSLVPGGLAAHDVEDYGVSVALDGDRVVVGALGSAFVFTRRESSGTWEQTAALAAGQTTNVAFGETSSISGSVVAVSGSASGAAPGGLAYACDLEDLTRESCRIAIPIVEDLVTMSDLVTSCCVGPDFSITATFTNVSGTAIPSPFFDVVEITGGNLLSNADDGPGGEGATLTPDVSDGVLSPKESVTVTFVIRLLTRDRFWFLVRKRGNVLTSK